MCLNGATPNEAGCSRGLVFNPDTEKCDKPENVPGCEDTYAKRGRRKPKRHLRKVEIVTIEVTLEVTQM